MTKESLKTLEPTEIDWAKMAAFIDGEGCICIQSSYNPNRRGMHTTYNLHLDIANTDFRMPLWCAERFGGRLLTRKVRSVKHKPAMHWFTWGRGAQEVLEGCLPHFVIKREQAEVALEFMATFAETFERGKATDPKVRTKRMELHHKLHQMKRPQLFTEGVSKFPEPAISGKEEVA
jgi:hypothetical protein